MCEDAKWRNALTQRQRAIWKENLARAWKEIFPQGQGKAKKGYVIHHIDDTLKWKDVERYILLLPADIVCISHKAHTTLHSAGSKNAFYGHAHTFESRKKMSEARKQYWEKVKKETR